MRASTPWSPPPGVGKAAGVFVHTLTVGHPLHEPTTVKYLNVKSRPVGVEDGVADLVVVAVDVGVGVPVTDAVGVRLGEVVGEGVAVAVGVALAVAVAVAVAVGVAVGDAVGVRVIDGVGVGEAVGVGVDDIVGVAVSDAVGVAVTLAVGVAVIVGVGDVSRATSPNAGSVKQIDWPVIETPPTNGPIVTESLPSLLSARPFVKRTVSALPGTTPAGYVIHIATVALFEFVMRDSQLPELLNAAPYTPV